MKQPEEPSDVVVKKQSKEIEKRFDDLEKEYFAGLKATRSRGLGLGNF